MKFHKLSFLILIIFILSTIGFSQNVDRFGRQSDTALEFPKFSAKSIMMDKSKQLPQLQAESLLYTPIEKTIDPETYIIGPGDQLGISINTLENFNFIINVGPAGDILIPTVGVIDVDNMTLKECCESIKNFVKTEAYQTAEVYVYLQNIRQFKIQIAGAVNKPGFFIVNPFTRLHEVIEMAEGFHPFAKEFEIEILNENNKTIINYLNFVEKGDLENNPQFSIGDRIYVPFGNFQIEGVSIRGIDGINKYDIIQKEETLGQFLKRNDASFVDLNFDKVVIKRYGDSKEEINFVKPDELFSFQIQPGDIIEHIIEQGVSVNGFVQVPGGYKYFSGYTCADYIGLAGGNSKEGNIRKAIVKHADGTIEKGISVIIRRGDQIIVPRSISQWLVGNSSIFQIIATMASVYMSYLAATN